MTAQLQGIGRIRRDICTVIHCNESTHPNANIYFIWSDHKGISSDPNNKIELLIFL